MVLCLVPVYGILEVQRVGPFGEATVIQADANLGWTYWGLLLVVAMGGVLGALIPGDLIRQELDSVGAVIKQPPLWLWAVGVGLLSTALAAGTSRLLFEGLPTSVDGMASLLQARFMAEGRWAGPVPEPAAAFLVLNTIATPEGWVSLYPPSHLVMLAAGFAAHAVWLVGPVLLGISSAGIGVAVEHLFPDRKALARTGALMCAVSPFLLLLGAGYLSHVSATAFLTWSLVAALWARDRGWPWALVAGLLVGLAVTSRPWIGLVLGTAFTAGLWIHSWWREDHDWAWILGRSAAVTAGGLPVALAWFAYNQHFFGDALTLGYSYAYGSSHGLGFHPDPWGNVYTIREAIGYTSANLLALGVNLFESPLSIVVLVGGWLVATPRLPRGTGIFVAWATLPMLANLFYWHHGFHLGPRMLYEGAPAWAVLTTFAAVALATRGRHSAPGSPSGSHEPEDVGPPEGSDSDESGGGLHRPPLRDVVLWAVLIALVTAPFLIVQRGLSYAHTEEALARFEGPIPPEDPALVFVHGSWAERLSARLQGDGMTLDSLETVLQRNDICDVQRYVSARMDEAPREDLPELDFDPLPGYPDHLRSVMLSEGNRIFMDPDRPFDERCRREAAADRNGVVALAPLVWQGDLPGIEDGRPMFVRDLGPEENQGLLTAYPDRHRYVYASAEPGALPRLHEYEEGMRMLWRDTP